jgi:metal-sulfur cluster biosynthetic enzyme
MSAAPRYEYAGDPALEASVGAALRHVVEAHPGSAKVRLTMTSPACPVVEVIVDDVRHELALALGKEARIDVEVVWDPPWSPERMSERARSTMGW